MADPWSEIRKIPPVTRFLCLASIAVTLSARMELVPPSSLHFVRHNVLNRFELWRIPTSFFLGSYGLAFVFDLVTLYHASETLETSDFLHRSADYAWQIFLVASAVLLLNVPLQSSLHARALLLALAYLHSKRAPPGAKTSLMGLMSIPYVSLSYILTAIDPIVEGPSAAARAATGMIAGHIWWWGMYDTGALRALGSAPGWLRELVEGPDGGDRPRGGVQVAPGQILRQPETWGGWARRCCRF